MTGWGTIAAWRQARQTCEPGCYGYHATWPLLRRLGLKASPLWHADLYQEHLTDLGDQHRPRILVAGAADHMAVKTLSQVLDSRWVYIEVVDRCTTPLATIDRWFGVDHLTFHQGIEDLDLGELLYEAVVCDGLLSLLPDDAARHQVLSRLAAVLRPTGRLIYTTRLSVDGRPLEYDLVGRLVQAAASLTWRRRPPTRRRQVALDRWRSPARSAPYITVARLRSDLEQHFADVEIDVDTRPPTRALRLHPRHLVRGAASSVVRVTATAPIGAQ